MKFENLHVIVVLPVDAGVWSIKLKKEATTKHAVDPELRHSFSLSDHNTTDPNFPPPELCASCALRTGTATVTEEGHEGFFAQRHAAKGPQLAAFLGETQ